MYELFITTSCIVAHVREELWDTYWDWYSYVVLPQPTPVEDYVAVLGYN